MRVTSAVAIACTMLLLVSCSSSSSKPKAGVAAKSNKDLLVGKWEPTDEKEKGAIMEFTKDGKFKMSQDKMVMEGTYNFVDDNHIEMDYQTMMGEKLPTGGQKQKIKVEVTQDELTTTEEGKGKGKVQKAKRVK